MQSDEKTDNAVQLVAYNSNKGEEDGHLPMKTEPVPEVAGSESGHFEDVIDLLGKFGHWQRVIFVVLCLPDLLGAFAMLLPVLTGKAPKWRCTEYTSEANGSVAVNGSNYFNSTASCYVGDFRCTGFHFYDDYTTIVSEWDLLCDKKFITNMVNTIQMSGLIVGAGIFGYLADLFGRKKCYFITVFTISLAGVGSAFTYQWETYALARFFVGFGFGSYMVVNCVYPLEFVGPRWRTLCGTIGGWAIGIMILALFGYFIRDWRYLTAATSATGFLFFLSWFIIPESPRWLLQRGKIEEAHVIVDKIAKKNKVATPPIELLRKIAEESERREAHERMYTYLDLFKTREYTKRTIVAGAFWFYGFIAYYTLSYNLKHYSGNRYLNMFYGGLVDLPAMLSVIFFNNWMGRRKALIMYSSITLLTGLAVIGIQTAEHFDVKISDQVTLGFALIGRGAALAVTYVIAIYTAELYATVVRNLGMGAGAVCGRIGGMVAPQMVLLGTYLKMAPYIMCAGLGLIIIPLAMLLPETLGIALDELPPEEIRKEKDVVPA